jgi:putative flippase GtrA
MNFFSNMVLSSRRFWRFAVVGGIGFCVDGGLLALLLKNDCGIVSSRMGSFLAAVTATWMLNRIWTFSPGNEVSKRREYLYYLVTQSGGALINLAIFFSLIAVYPHMREFPLVPFSIGSVVALTFNYLVSKKYVFNIGHE